MMPLPSGWFYDQDIDVYRRYYKNVIPERGTTAEIGVYQGRSICSVADIVMNKQINVVAVDRWEPFPPLYPEPDNYERFMENAARYGLLSRLTIQQGDSVETADKFLDYSFDFVFIDADHRYEYVKADIASWWPKVKVGGWIAGHDYGTEGNHGVVEAVVEKFGPYTRQGDSYIWAAKKEQSV